MFLRGNVLVLITAWLSSGCSGRLVSDADPNGDADTGPPTSDAAVEIDPGRPSSEFGTRCSVELTDLATNAQIVFDNCTVSAVSSDRSTHLFLLFPLLPRTATRMYTSLVLGTTPLSPGNYARALAGAIETTLSDGRFLSAGDVKKESSFRLSVNEVGATPMAPTVHYVKGALETILVDVANGASKYRLRAVLG